MLHGLTILSLTLSVLEDFLSEANENFLSQMPWTFPSSQILSQSLTLPQPNFASSCMQNFHTWYEFEGLHAALHFQEEFGSLGAFLETKRFGV